MILKIKTDEINFHLEGEQLKIGNYLDSTINKEFLDFLKKIIEKVAEETIKIKQKP